MSRTLAVVFSTLLLNSVLLVTSALGANCTPPPTANCITGTSPCKVPLKWFKDNEGCTGAHSEIKIGHSGQLVVASPNVQFTVQHFLRHPPNPSGGCDWNQVTPGPVHPLTEPSSLPALSHTLTAQPGSNGCYKVIFGVPGGGTIDPHIIVSGNNQ